MPCAPEEESILSKARSIGGLGTSIVLALAVAACGGSSSSSSSSSSSGGAPSSGGKTVTLAMGVPPDSLDPGFGYTTQAAESSWLVYTGLVTYAHESGAPGGHVIAGL